MRRIAVLTVLLTAMLLTATACSGSSKPKVLYQPVPGNSELVVGKNRVAMAIVDKKNTPLLGAPGTSVQLQFRDSEGQPIGEPNDMTFVEALPGTSGFWVLSHQFDQAGQQNATVIINVGESKQSVDITFGIQAKGKAPMIGDPAPPTENATLSSQPNKKALTTDPSPNDAFYQMTVTQALAAHKPFVVVFATPAFCQSALCGPILDNVKSVQPEFAGRVNFIHIEPYKLNDQGGLAGNTLTPAQSTNDWNLQTEPWIFIVGADGKINDRFEASASPAELRAAIQAVLS